MQRLRQRFFEETKSTGPSDLFIGSEEEEGSWVWGLNNEMGWSPVLRSRLRGWDDESGSRYAAFQAPGRHLGGDSYSALGCRGEIPVWSQQHQDSNHLASV